MGIADAKHVQIAGKESRAAPAFLQRPSACRPSKAATMSVDLILAWRSSAWRNRQTSAG
jgi:hypothetical protein